MAPKTIGDILKYDDLDENQYDEFKEVLEQVIEIKIYLFSFIICIKFFFLNQRSK